MHRDPREFHSAVTKLLREMQPAEGGPQLARPAFARWSSAIVSHSDRQEIAVELIVVMRRLIAADCLGSAAQMAILVALAVGSSEAEKMAVHAGIDPTAARNLIRDGGSAPLGLGSALTPPVGKAKTTKKTTKKTKKKKLRRKKKS